uniref:Succinate--CoA ligase [ADP-forming] subunit beta, mitochondrial n=1 Tax=Paramoeba aestuarina TaxID=180227 RepID=A0A7S4KUM1_9EUKA|mmetsp:Transcript_25741/g.40155  ORF Transcript_25741/g.40155 Transcript_25741/m.40155 type:complete len:446 (+) Transcript_25741:128-1465(+)|eukprot:CAMPEP_0201519460 /NCGR_PEP_ID=MMETSP0161_2-20130828/10004_1 /ASSEMBLY_ACC=CAM_ASM_000251 /TAXON_ID=180227 /ORGANISM="Neoparamoeba aestuarina, Strain SoJaBio B1-5/56/2" /LENGTH=445 /DNA_ID=CAMNT_0047917495 /DNA_START=119 /DNA_END=1456 /DNA_ORIENTATION=+
MAFLSRGFSVLARPQTLSRWSQVASPTSSLIQMTPQTQSHLTFQRNLNIHEYQSQNLLRKYGVAVPDGGVGHSPSEAAQVARDLKVDDVVVKAQVLAGGRGKGHFDDGFQGGVHLCKVDEVESFASKMIGKKLITKQTGEEGKPCNSVLVAKRFSVAREMYVAILLDRETSSVVVVGSPAGGMNIEEVAEQTPEKIHKLFLDIEALSDVNSIPQEKLNEMARNLGLEGDLVQKGADQLRNLIRMFVDVDSTMLEINPLIETKEGELLFADAKVNVDDNAAFRQKDVFDLRDFSQEDSREVEASKFDLNYIGLQGNIGCLVNGAGLAMATMDIIKLKGGAPANFLDIGGSANEAQVCASLRILMDDPSVKAILINVFGGIMKCDVIASGLLNAVRELDLKVPLIVRLKGTNVDIAKDLIEKSGLPIITASDISDAAEKAVAALPSS